MSDLNKNNRGDELDESIDFMMKKRKQGTPAETSSAQGRGQAGSRAAGQTPSGQRIGSAGQTPSGQRISSAGQTPSGQRISSAGQTPSGQRISSAGQTPSGQRISSAGQTPSGQRIGSAGQTPSGQRISSAGQTPSGQRISSAGQTPSGQKIGSAGQTPSGQRISSAGQTPSGQRIGSAGQTPSDQRISSAGQNSAEGATESKSEFVTSGQRIVPKEKVDRNRPINIKRTNDDVDNQATRKTDISERVQNEKEKKKADKKGGSDLGGELVVSMVKAIIYIVFVVVVAAVISVFTINVGNDVFAFVKSDEMVEVEIPENAKTSDIAEILYQNGIIKYKGIFELYGNIKDIEENYVSGTYSVSPSMNYKSLFYEFKPKRISGTSRITIPEGYTVDEIIDLMLSHNIGGTKEDYVKVINEGEFDYWFVEELETNGWSESRFYRLEGYLFPDTYEFYNASDAYTVVNRMLKRFSEIYTEAYKTRAAEIGFTTDQVVTLASMIEKEAGFSSDFRNVSSVFHNRLNNSGTYPRLESDATVVYAIHHITGERPTEVTGETISYVSPYNTYQNNGLPPGAISNPGMNALKYALYPADTNYYFFVSSKSGTTLFATNVAGHEANKATVKSEQ